MLKHSNLWTLPTWAWAMATASAFAAVSPDEAKKLGTTLSAVGAELAGNADKTIPPYTGGLTAAPADYQKGSGVRPDPYAGEKPLYAITGANAAQYESRLTVGTRELLKRYPSMRVDVYPSHRSAAYPKYVLDNSVKNATSVKAIDGGLGVQGTYAGIPFPIPKTGNEAMWNHLLRYAGHAYVAKYDSINVSSTGSAVLATTGEITVEYPYYDPKRGGTSGGKDIYFRTKVAYSAPARRVGEALLIQDYINPLENARKGWQYLPGQRRVKLSPDLSYDTPNPATAGTSTFDDSFVFSGALDRYDWKLLGKREMIVPYNAYKLSYARDPYAVTTPKHVNPDYLRWELHRVWVVEGTLKDGKRHIYSKRTFYLDEDSWYALASDQFDGRGLLYRAGFTAFTPAYEQPAPGATSQFFYDFASGSYNIIGLLGAYPFGLKYMDGLPEKQWTPDALGAAGVR
jgi:hypothetical protein